MVQLTASQLQLCGLMLWECREILTSPFTLSVSKADALQIHHNFAPVLISGEIPEEWLKAISQEQS